MEQWLTKLWYRDNAGLSLLQPLAWLYGSVMELRRKAYAKGWLTIYGIRRPVIIVGNLTVGGTGKTPLVIWLVRRLSDLGLRVGIVSRGYGAKPGEAPRVVTEESNWREVGDEPLLLHLVTGCVTVVGHDRVAAARTLVDHGVDVIVADDGLQHLRLARNCEIVVIDGARGFGNRRLLPLRRVGVPVEARAMLMTLMPGEAVRLDGGGNPRPLDEFRGRPVHAVAGIGHPERFFRDLTLRGLEVIEHPFPDHHPFAARDLSFDDDLPVLMTQKDAVKFLSFADSRLWSVPTAATFSEMQARELLDRVLQKIHYQPDAGG
jgi:tetraacyldisaccharide 4'-kinase